LFELVTAEGLPENMVSIRLITPRISPCRFLIHKVPTSDDIFMNPFKAIAQRHRLNTKGTTVSRKFEIWTVVNDRQRYAI